VKLGTLAILLSLFIGGGSVYMLKQQSTQYQTQVAELQSQLKGLSHNLSGQLSDTQAALQSVTNGTQVAIEQQGKSIESLQLALAEVKGRRPNDWLLAEADYLVKLAGRKLFLEKDVVSATKLMESADQRISVLNDPSLVPLRKEMAKDITTLRAVPLIDKDGLALRLMSLQEQVDTLPLANAILPDAPEEVHQEVSEDIQDWQQNLMTSLKDFSEQFITFRTRDGNVIPLLSPKQDFYLRENIKGKLESAIHAVYDEHGEIYTTALTLANQWSQQFFKLDDPAVKEFNKTLGALSGQNITVSYPVKLQSQKALADVIRERLRRDITSMIGEEKQ
jgi:uroporphyrin-3 C-methyltransferase